MKHYLLFEEVVYGQPSELIETFLNDEQLEDCLKQSDYKVVQEIPEDEYEKLVKSGEVPPCTTDQFYEKWGTGSNLSMLLDALESGTHFEKSTELWCDLSCLSRLVSTEEMDIVLGNRKITLF